MNKRLKMNRRKVMLLSVFLALAILPLFASRLPLEAIETIGATQGAFGNSELPNWKNITVTDYGSYITVDNGDGFVFRLPKSNDENVIFQNGTQIVAGEFWVVTRDGKQPFTYQSLTWTQPEPYHVTVKRFYRDYGSPESTYWLVYDFYGGFRSKISVEMDVEKAGAYAIIWKATGINKANHADEPDNRRVKIWDSGEEAAVFDYTDVYESLGNITTVAVSWAEQKKLDVTFNVGSLGVGAFRLDPNFGYETIGTAGGILVQNYIRGSVFTITEDGTANSITAALGTQYSQQSRTVKCAIYKHSDLSLVGVTEERTVSMPYAYTWFTFKFTDPKPSLTANTDYILVAWGTAGTIYLAYDAGSTNQGHYQSLTYTGNFPNPLVPSHDGCKYSIYCSYTVSNPTHTLTITASSGGTTDPSPGNHTYNAGTNVTVTATPDNGYDFLRWVLDGVDQGNGLQINVTMNVDHVLKAYFSDKDWPMFHHDSAHTGYTTSTGPTTNQTLWIFSTGAAVYSSPVVADGYVYVGSTNGKIYCLNATTGAEVWNYITGDGIYYSPAVADGYVYVGSYDDKVYCLNASTGTEVWNYTAGGDIGSSPAVANGYVYVGSFDCKVYCLNATTGAKVWSYTTGNNVLSPAVFDSFVYVGSAGHKVYCLNALTGAYVWSYTTGGGAGSPAVADGYVYVGSYDDKVYCLNASTGTEVWNYTAGGDIASCPAIANGYVYVNSLDNEIYCLNATSGAYVWNYTVSGTVSYRVSPAVANGYVYAGFNNGFLCSLNATTGEFVLSFGTTGVIASSPAIANGMLFIGNLDYKVHCFGAGDPYFTVTFTHTGLDVSATGTVVTVDGVNYTYVDLPKSFQWEDGTEHTYAYADPVSSSTDGKRFSLINVTGPSSPFNVTEDVEITGNYQTQWQVTFTHTGLDASANSTVVTVNGTAKNYGDLPYSFWVDNGDTVTYSYTDPVSSSTDGKRFHLTGVTGPSSPITVSAKSMVTGAYTVQWQVTITTSGMDATASGTVVTINGVPKNYAALPYVDWLNSGSTLTYSFEGEVESSTTGKQFKWTSNTGPSSPKTVNEKITVTGNYKVQWWVVFAQAGLDNTAQGTIVTVNGANKVYGDLPFGAWYDYGATITYSYVNPATSSTSNKRFNLTSVSGSGSPITVSASETVTGNYQAQWKITFTQTGLDASITETIVTINGTAKTYAQLPYVVWVNHNNILVFEYNATFPINDGKRIALKEVTGATSPLTVTASATITGVYVTQWKLTFTQTGLDGSATSVVFTVKGTSVYYANLPYEVWSNNNEVLVYAASNIVSSSNPGRSFVLSSITGYASPIIVTEASTVTANYAMRTTVTFSVVGLRSNTIGDVVSIDGSFYGVAQLPKIFAWPVSSSHTFSWNSPVEECVWAKTEGLSTLQGGIFVVPADGGEIKATYVPNTNAVTFSVVGLPSDTLGTVLTLDGAAEYTISDLPTVKYYVSGSSHTFSWTPNITVNSIKYEWFTTTGLSTLRGGIVTMTTAGNITAYYRVSGAEEEWGESIAVSNVEVYSIIHAKEFKLHFYACRFWLFYSNGTLYYTSAPYDQNKKQLGAWTTPQPFFNLTDPFDSNTPPTYPWTHNYISGENFATAVGPEGHIYVLASRVKTRTNASPLNYYYYLFYRAGQMNADGSITWLAGWKFKMGNIGCNSNEDIVRLSIAVDSAGYPAIGYTLSKDANDFYFETFTEKTGNWTSTTFQVANFFPSLYFSYMETQIQLFPLQDKKILIVYYGQRFALYQYCQYVLCSRLWDGSNLQAQVIIESRSCYNSGHIIDNVYYTGTSVNDTVYLVVNYEISRELKMYTYTLDYGWTVSKSVSTSVNADSYPAVGLRYGKPYVFWYVDKMLMESFYDGNWTVKLIHVELGVYQGTLTCMFAEGSGGEFALAFIFGTDKQIKVLYVPYLPTPPVPPPPPPIDFHVNLILALIGIIMFFVGLYRAAKRIRDRDLHGAFTAFLIAVIGFVLVIAGLTA